MGEGAHERDEVPEPRPVVGPWGFSQGPEPSHGRAQYLVWGFLMALPIWMAEGWVRDAFASGRTTRPYRRILVGLVLATVVWAVVQRVKHGRRYHPFWMVIGVVAGLVAWEIVFRLLARFFGF